MKRRALSGTIGQRVHLVRSSCGHSQFSTHPAVHAVNRWTKSELGKHPLLPLHSLQQYDVAVDPVANNVAMI